MTETRIYRINHNNIIIYRLFSYECDSSGKERYGKQTSIGINIYKHVFFFPLSYIVIVALVIIYHNNL